MQLTKNFTLEEFTQSDTAERIGGSVLQAQRNPPPHIVANIKRQAEKIWQPCRDELGYAIDMSSGYRCDELNALTAGSSDTSQHPKGEAGDAKLRTTFFGGALFEIKKQIEAITQKPLRSNVNANFYLFAWLCINIDRMDIDQVIHEYGTDGCPAWVHGSCSETKNKRQILIKRTGAKYETLTLKQALLLGC
jgi:hypothetical protein